MLFEKLLHYQLDTQNEGKEAFGIPAASSYRLWDSTHSFECFLLKLLKRLFSAGDLHLRGGLAKDLRTEDILLHGDVRNMGCRTCAVFSSFSPPHILNVGLSMK